MEKATSPEQEAADLKSLEEAMTELAGRSGQPQTTIPVWALKALYNLTSLLTENMEELEIPTIYDAGNSQWVRKDEEVIESEQIMLEYGLAAALLADHILTKEGHWTYGQLLPEPTADGAAIEGPEESSEGAASVGEELGT